MSILSKLSSRFSSDDKSEEERLEELKEKKKKLEKEVKVKRMKEEVDKLESRSGGRGGFLSKIGGAVKDLGKSGENRALSELVGPREPEKKTEEFVMGRSIRRENGDSVSGFLLGNTNPERKQDPGIDFPFKGAGKDSEEDLEDIMGDQLGVNP